VVAKYPAALLRSNPCTAAAADDDDELAALPTLLLLLWLADIGDADPATV
jgi:hypothetical protein